MPSPCRLVSLRSAILFVLVLPFSYLLATAILSAAYIHVLLHPDCPSSTTDQNRIPALQSIQLSSSEYLTLKGWYHPPANGVVILLLGGLGSGRDSMLPDGEMLAAHGYGFVTLEPRVCAGRISTLGFKEATTLDTMVEFSLLQPEVERLGALGFSVGGTAVILGAVDQPAIQAIVAEGNYANLYQEITAHPSTLLSPRWCVQRWVALLFLIKTGIWVGAVSPIDSLSELHPRPVLLIHGELEADRTRADAQLAASGRNTTLWLVPGARHGDYRSAVPQAYEQQVTAFFNQAFFPEAGIRSED